MMDEGGWDGPSLGAAEVLGPRLGVVEDNHAKEGGNVTGSWDQTILMDRGKFWNRPKDYYRRKADLLATRWQLAKYR
jgi:hypothetical protein